MGDEAERQIEEGMDAWSRHISGDCGPDRCQYCEDEERAREKRREKRKTK